jgi:WD40 repeat protein
MQTLSLACDGWSGLARECQSHVITAVQPCPNSQWLAFSSSSSSSSSSSTSTSTSTSSTSSSQPGEAHHVLGMYDMQRGLPMWTLDCSGGGQPDRALHQQPLTCLAFSSDGALLAAGDEAGVVSIWGVQRGYPLRLQTMWVAAVL